MDAEKVMKHTSTQHSGHTTLLTDHKASQKELPSATSKKCGHKRTIVPTAKRTEVVPGEVQTSFHTT